MKVILWFQSPQMPLLNYALNTIGRNYGAPEFVGVVPAPEQRGLTGYISINNQVIPFLNKTNIAGLKYDIILVGGMNLSVPDVLNQVEQLGLDVNKVAIDRATLMTGFTVERYKNLRQSQLSIMSMGNLGTTLNNTLGTLASVIDITASDRDFLNLISDPLRHINSNLRSKTNWFNLLVMMYTEDPAVLAEFDRLPYSKKVCFVPFETNLNSGYYIKPYYVGRANDFEETKILERSFARAVEAVVSNKIVCFDLWDILLYGKKTVMNVEDYSKVRTIIAPGPTTCSTTDGKIKYFNWDVIDYEGGNHQFLQFNTVNNADNIWLTRFIRSNVSTDKSFNFFSVFGDQRFVRGLKAERKVFFTIEEVHSWPWTEGYEDYCMPSVDLAIGSNVFNAPKYMRLPFWTMLFFEPTINRDLIEQRVAEFNNSRSTGKYECVLINRHDFFDTRRPIYLKLKDVLDIKCAGKWNRNTDELQTVYKNNKRDYVHEFKFNICPENINYSGYVTEKIFDAFRAGSIPIYYGSDNRPEPGLINPNAVLFFDPKSDNQELVKEVRRLKSDEAYYNKFISQEKLFVKPTVEFVYSTLEELAKRLREMQ